MNNNNSHTKFDILPTIMNSQHKLLEPAYLRNTRSKFSHNESKVLPPIQRSSIIKQLVVQRLVLSLDFSNRHFGAACDRGFQGLSKFHYSQKFGHSSARLEPLNRNVVTELTDTEDTESIPKEDRTYFKKIYKYQKMPILALIKSCEIEWIREFEGEVNKKSTKPLQLTFQMALAIFNTHSDPLDFFQKNLQLLERNTVALKQKGLNRLKYKVKHFNTEEFQRVVVIKNQSGLGFFRIYFPIIQLYHQEYQYIQTIDLSPQKLYDIVKNNFFEMHSFAEQFDNQNLQLYLQSKLDHELILQDLNEPQSQQQISQSDLLINPQDNALIKNWGFQQLIVNLQLINFLEKHEFPEKILSQRWIKKVTSFDNNFYTCDFLPTQILIREKISQQIIKIYSPTLKELDSIIDLLNTKNMQQILDEHVVTIFDLPPEAFNYKDFKKGTKIKLNLPEITEQPIEITEEQINNGLLNYWTKEIEINNKDLQIIIEPCILEIYDQLKASTIKRVCTSKELTQILSKRYQITYRLI
ncbi:unnamed protein product (macronuclear) [Paramecium tetraurelia]|uniref:Uncharacterized protein n=1 Tax=Paramecium tetraurelia TaxID=5888 RepID=A0E589_PARTE|nr:uncharacterized protein GSPATT00023633001 [Paramecium tetraurelia]CAK90456.1 unnamed protein product [Paramecium tetraurelia]|eukprot:XP_001457853.1 hypothetical protein (macronuclear) [Paramecium tetraurelia strain d4-2]